MGVFNTYTVSERNQRPSFNGRTILRSYFMRDGGYVSLDNSSVSSVMLFKKEANTSPSSILDPNTGLVTDTAAATAVWRWTLKGWEYYTTGGDVTAPYPTFFVESDYDATIGPTTSGIFSVGTGRLAVVLDGTIDGSCLLRDLTQIGAASGLSGEPAATYIDVWTVKLCAGCEWTTFINDTAFFQNNAVILSEPLLCSTRERLYNKRIEKGSVEKLKIGVDITIENKTIDDSTKNVLRDGLITSGGIEVIYHNEKDIHSEPWVSVVTAGTPVDIAGDNTFLYSFDTTADNVVPGTYSAQITYSILDELRLSPLMYFTVV